MIEKWGRLNSFLRILTESRIFVNKHRIMNSVPRRLALLCIIFFYQILDIQAQNLTYYPLGKVKFSNEKGQEFSFPLTGGLSAPQFQSMDVNLDGKEDLIVFDRTTRNLATILPFIDTGYSGNPIWVYRPEFSILFPKLRDWMILVDYDRDGLKDIFTGDNGYVDVYKNKTKNGKLNFEFVHDNLCDTDFYSKGYCSWIYSQSGNLPAITDFDGDGDVDFITLNIIGGYFSYYKNQQVEAGLPKDSLAFKWVDDCWGSLQLAFSENNADLGISCEKWYPKQAAHLGSAITVADLDNDGDVEMIHGDVGYSNLIMLKNGRKEFAWPWDTIVSVDTVFPAYNLKADIPFFPAAFLLDVDQDGIKDMVVAPSDYDLSENRNHVLRYENTQTNQNPKFEFRQKDFLVGDMIDFGKQAAPTFMDVNHDGFTDLLVAASGAYSISKDSTTFFHLFLNKGGDNFELTDTNWLNASTKKLRWGIPFFGDMDHDGDSDLVVGQANGKIAFWENSAGKGMAPVFVFKTDFYDSIERPLATVPWVGNFDGDTLTDLLLGNYNGTVSWYEQKSNPNSLQFELNSDTLASINVADSLWDSGTNEWRLRSEGMAAPEVCDLDTNGILDLLVGSMTGKLRWFPDAVKYINDSCPGGTIYQFNIRMDSSVIPDYQARLIPRVLRLDDDSLPDILMGLWRGGLVGLGSKYYKDSIPIGNKVNQAPLIPLLVYPNPASDYVDIQTPWIMPQNAMIHLFNMKGQKVMEQEILKGSYETRLNTIQIPEGIYIARLISDSKILTSRFIIYR